MSVSKGRECPETSDHPAGRKHLIPSKIETGSGTDHSPEASGGCTYLKCNGIHGYRRDLSVQYLLFVYVPDGNGLPGGGSTGAASSKRNPFLGLDYSQKDLYVDSEGRKANYPKYYRRSEQKLARLQKSVCRKEKNGKNYQKTMRKIQKLHTKIKHQRHDYLQKLSTELVSRYDVIVVEDINLRAMGGCLSLGKNLHDNGFGLFMEMLTYKLWKKGSCLVRIDRMYPSSKTCSVCGAVKPDLKLSDRIYICPKCGCVIDRDYNAAVNIREEGKRIFLTYLKEAMEKAEEAKNRQEAVKERRQKKKRLHKSSKI